MPDALSVCSGIGGIDLGLKRAGWTVVAQCERCAYRRGVLSRHWPSVPCFEDIREVSSRSLGERLGQVDREPPSRRRHRLPSVDLLAGGTPCQDLSVAGRRAGLVDGDRSSLFFEFARIADDLVRPAGWLLFENVPGLLSSNAGRDFAIVLASLADIGFHDLAWRVLDSRYFGVPQRRRRIFIVARRATGDRARAVLLEPESGGGDFAPSAEARAHVAATLASGAHGSGISPRGRRQHDDENIVGTIGKRYGKGTDSDGNHLVAHTLRSEGFDASEDGTGRGTPLVAGTIRSHQRPGSNSSTDILCPPPDPDGVRAPSGLPGRLVDPQPDGPRYSACGDAVSVPVAHWIGNRLMVEFECR